MPENLKNFDKNKKEPWLKWLSLHLIVLEELKESAIEQDKKKRIEEVIEKIIKFSNEQLTWERFTEIFREVNDLFTVDLESMDRDSEGISNLALLGQSDNSALNNSVFEIKRREIIRLDKEGSFIPIATRRVFMKYFNDEGMNTQYFYWSESDRKKYFDSINDSIPNNDGILKKYLTKNHIEIEEDENE